MLYFSNQVIARYVFIVVLLNRVLYPLKYQHSSHCCVLLWLGKVTRFILSKLTPLIFIDEFTIPLCGVCLLDGELLPNKQWDCKSLVN